MKTTQQVIAALVFAVAGSAAVAGTRGDITTGDENFVSTRTRAEVQAEVLQARTTGVDRYATEGVNGLEVAVPSRSALTREQVRAEVRHAPRSRALILIDPAA